MSKESILMIIDGGKSMDEMYNEDMSRLKLAISCILMTVSQKIFHNSNHQIGLAIFGDRQENGKYISLHKLEKPTTEFLRKLQELSEARLDNVLEGGDIFDAILEGIYDMRKQCANKKVKKRMFLFTNGMGYSIYKQQPEFMKNNIAGLLKDNDIKLNIIPINFMEGYDMLDRQVGISINCKEQYANAKLLMELKDAADSHVQLFPDEIAVELYKKFRKREVNPVAIFKGQFKITQDIAISVETYKFVRRERMKSLAKYNMNEPFKPQVTKEKDVFISNHYIVQGDQANEPVENQYRMNAYAYGPQLVPVSHVLEGDSKWMEDKNLQLLGFTPKEKIPRYAFMGEVEMLIPSKSKDNLPGQKLFTSLIYSMITTRQWGLARYVPRNSKTGVSPRLVVLMPYRGIDREAIYLVELPTVEDVRDYPFRPLKPSTEEQKNLVKKMIKKSMLYQKIGDEEHEQVRMDTTFNPTIQYFYQTLFERVRNQSDQLPPLDQNIRNYITPEARIYEETQEHMAEMRAEFKLTKKPLSKEKVEKKNVMWKDVVENCDIVETATTMSETEEPMKHGKYFDFEEDDAVFDPSNPIKSFGKMLNNNKKDLVGSALKEMSNYIYVRSQNQMGEEQLKQLVDCARTLWNGCKDQQEKQFWDDWLTKAKSKLSPILFGKIIEEGLMFFNKDNGELRLRDAPKLPPVTNEEEFADLD